MSHNNVASCIARAWAQKSAQLTHLAKSMHAFLVCTILNVLNAAQHGFLSSVCSENRSA